MPIDRLNQGASALGDNLALAQRVIAAEAAPAMLAALQSTEALLSADPNHRRDGWMSDVLREVRAAIAKATGK